MWYIFLFFPKVGIWLWKVVVAVVGVEVIEEDVAGVLEVTVEVVGVVRVIIERS